jgi:hypothetical protein
MSPLQTEPPFSYEDCLADWMELEAAEERLEAAQLAEADREAQARYDALPEQAKRQARERGRRSLQRIQDLKFRRVDRRRVAGRIHVETRRGSSREHRPSVSTSGRRGSSRGSPDREDDPEPPPAGQDGFGPAAWHEAPEDRLLAYWTLSYVGLSELERNTLFDIKEGIRTVSSVAADEQVGEATIRQRVTRALNKAERWLARAGYPVPSRAVRP